MDWNRRISAFYNYARQVRNGLIVQCAPDPHQASMDKAWEWLARDAADYPHMLPVLRSIEAAPQMDNGCGDEWLPWRWCYLTDFGTIELRDSGLAVLLVAEVMGLNCNP